MMPEPTIAASGRAVPRGLGSQGAGFHHSRLGGLSIGLDLADVVELLLQR